MGARPFGELYKAVEVAANRPVMIHWVESALVPKSLDKVRAELGGAGKVVHKNVARLLDFGVEGTRLYAVSDLVEGDNLRALVAQRRQVGAGFSLKSAINIVAHICNALVGTHAVMAHGQLTSTSVLVNRAGRVKIIELGLARALPSFISRLTPEDKLCVAPEIRSGKPLDSRSDIYSIGAILFELLVGRPPAAGETSVCKAIPGLPPDLDRALGRCLAADPASRLTDLMVLKNGLWTVLDAAAKGLTVSGAPVNTAAPAASPAGPAGAAPKPAPKLAQPQKPANPKRHKGIDESDERWLIQKGKLDFGPYSLAKVREQIEADEIVPGNVLIDNDTGKRVNVEDHPLLHELVMHAQDKRDRMRRANAEAVVVKQDRRRGAGLYLLILAAVGTIGVGVFFVVKKMQAAKKAKVEEVASLKNPELKGMTMGAKKRPKRSGGGPKPGDPGWDDSMKFDMDEGDLGDDILSDSQINSVIGRYGDPLGACLLKTSSRKAEIDFIIQNTGKVSQVRVNGRTGTPLALCIREVLMGMQFPTFNGARTRASFDINL